MSEQKSVRKFHFIAVVLGLAVDNIGTLLSSGLIGSLFFANSTEQDVSAIYSNAALMIFLLVLGLFWTFLGGFLTAKVAKRGELFNAAIIGVIGAGIGFDSILTNDGVPLWYEWIGFVAIVPVALIGGYLALKRKKTT
ncbi:hypothetical protein A8709_31965 [Paenibacillus pectinilyticus]|uniref:Uncharacterized protein n=1 Tax=Paenibacillus pectinilyticus TaxID=512399 RepID=A0A1C0ZWF0_9BACL|nr:hypothetical protein [Paenibacillus pectinilyticus]OCT12444.1 hypothetical protein A8709_31965 [Paenibacillus pectinilyticus]